MKHFAKILVLGAALVAAVPFASATPISGSIGFGGNGSLNASGQFTAGGQSLVPGFNGYVNVAGTGTLSPFVGLTGATFSSFNAGTTIGPLSPTQPVFTTTVGGVTLTFTLTGLTSAPAVNGGGYGFTGTGILTETGFDSTSASFTLATNTSAGTFITFNTAAATPEPSSLMLLGSGLVSAAGMMIRRRRTV